MSIDRRSVGAPVAGGYSSQGGRLTPGLETVIIKISVLERVMKNLYSE